MFTPESFHSFSLTGRMKNISTSVEQNPGYYHLEANVITTTIGGGLSMIGVIFIVVSYIKLVKYRVGGTTAQTILLFISAADFLSAASNISGVWHQTQTATPACQTEGFIIIFSMTSSFFWTSCLTIHLYLIIMNKNHLISTSKKMFIFHAVGWGLPLVLAFIALGGNALGPSPALNKNESYIKLTTGGWCWIKDFNDDRKTLAWTMMTSKFWELSSYLLITVLCLTIFLKLRFKIQETDSIGENTLAEARKVEKRMMFIPIAFILLRIWGTVRYFAFLSPLSVRTSVLKNIPLYAMQGLGDSGQGFANSIFFGISNKRVFEYWKYVITGFFHGFLCYKSDSEDSERTPIIYSLNVDQKERANNC